MGISIPDLYNMIDHCLDFFFGHLHQYFNLQKSIDTFANKYEITFALRIKIKCIKFRRKSK